MRSSGDAWSAEYVLVAWASAAWGLFVCCCFFLFFFFLFLFSSFWKYFNSFYLCDWLGRWRCRWLWLVAGWIWEMTSRWVWIWWCHQSCRNSGKSKLVLSAQQWGRFRYFLISHFLTCIFGLWMYHIDHYQLASVLRVNLIYIYIAIFYIYNWQKLMLLPLKKKKKQKLKLLIEKGIC